jgi:acyl-CoA thioester hydrolase
MGVAFAVRSVNVEYLKPARLDDALVVESTIVAVGGATADGIQIVRRAEDGAELARVGVRLACIRLAGGQPSRIPAAVRAALSRHIVVTKA